jgi:hypothetical protein
MNVIITKRRRFRKPLPEDSDPELNKVGLGHDARGRLELTGNSKLMVELGLQTRANCDWR